MRNEEKEKDLVERYEFCLGFMLF